MNKVEEYRQLQKIICDELNVHEVRRMIAVTEKGKLELCVTSDLGFVTKQNEIFLRLDGKRIDNKKLLEKIVMFL